MRLPFPKRARRASGFTIIESMVSLAIFGVVGYALAVVVDVGNHSQQTVIRTAAQGRALRSATTCLTDELRSSSDAQITVTVLGDGNHQVRFMMPIEVAGAMTWGVHDKTLGQDPADQDRPGWFIQYTVRTVGANRQLVRQVLDNALVVQREHVITDGLRSGADVPPGFRMVRNGAMWEITLSTVGSTDGEAGIRAVFHVQTRN